MDGLNTGTDEMTANEQQWELTVEDKERDHPSGDYPILGSGSQSHTSKSIRFGPAEHE